MKEETLELLDKIALTLRGMTLDPTIANHTKDVMRRLIEQIESAIEMDD